MNDCRARLHEMAERGKRGWDDPAWQQNIAADLAHDGGEARDYGERNHLHDIANRAMMLWWMARRVSQKWMGGDMTSCGVKGVA